MALPKQLQVEILETERIERDNLRPRAYPVWAYELGQSIPMLHDWIRDTTGLDIPLRTLYHWAKTDGWRLRFEHDRSDIDPAEARPAIALRLQHAAINAADYLAAVNAGDVTPTRERLTAAKMALDAAGFAAIHVSGIEAQSRSSSTTQRTDFAKLTDAELRDRLKRLRASTTTD